MVVDEKALEEEGGLAQSDSLKDAKEEFKTVLLTESDAPRKDFDHTIQLPFDPMNLSCDLRSFLS